MKMNKNTRISIKVPVNLHFMAQRIAKENSITLTRWMISAMLEKMMRDGEVKVVELTSENELTY
jgi:hypothetical protein